MGVDTLLLRQDMKLKSYKKGATCKYCINLKTKTKIQSSSTRQVKLILLKKIIRSIHLEKFIHKK